MTRRSEWQEENAKRCGCRGSDDYCPCQNDEFHFRPKDRPRRYEAQGHCVLDAFGGERAFRVIPIMGQSDEEVDRIVRIVVDALNQDVNAA